MPNPPENPFASPPDSTGTGSPASFAQQNYNEYAPCPKCGIKQSTLIAFTWWGGLIGSRILTHVVCPQCKTKYNGKSGQSNTLGITIYMVVSFIIGVAIVTLLGLLLLA